jgi:K+-sensing histidine kinase KdpD
VPLTASVVSSFATYIIFISFQLTLKDYMNLQLEKERQFLFDVEELKNNFLSLISHDLKTPIAKIQAICDRMLAEAHDTSVTGDVTALREEATELHRYIHTILQITRVESRDFRIKKDASDINEIISTVAGKLQVLAKNKKIELVLDLEPMFLIEVDAVLMREVVLNLIENAIKYTQEGGRVTISSREIEDQVYVMVEDNGPGVPKEEQERIFDKFYRGESGKSQPKGSGLGLYLVKYFIELHRGKIIFESEPKRGTKVGFRLPLADDATGEGEKNEAVS